MAKRVLDFGRLDYVRTELGLATARLCYYVDADVSLENVVIVAGEEET
jgi:hypothetical protein